MACLPLPLSRSAQHRQFSPSSFAAPPTLSLPLTTTSTTTLHHDTPQLHGALRHPQPRLHPRSRSRSRMPVVAHNAYTNEPGEGPFVIFPTHAHQILSNCIHIIGVSILSFCFARRTESDQFGTRQWWASLTWARLLVVLLFLDSWIFLAFSGVLVNGVGLSLSVPVCSLGIYACIIFYAGSKALIYLFLVERVWIVWSAGNTLTRFQSRIYKVCALVVLGYLVIFVDMIIGRVAQIRSDGVCIIGLRSFATIPLLSYDLFVNVFLTSMFLWALYREQNVSQRLRRLARRTFLAALVALITSSVNIIILATLDGKQLGWVCLASCAADVSINALVLFWVTAGGHRESHHKHTLTLPTLHLPVSFVRDPSQRTETDPEQVGHSSLKDLEDATAAKSLSLRGSEIQFCNSPYPHRHRFSCDYDANAYRYSHASSPTSPTSAKGGVFFSNSVHNRDEELDEGLVEEDEWDIIDSSLGHNTMKDEMDGEIWRMPTLMNNSPLHLHPSSSVNPEPESPAYSMATEAMHGSYTRLVPAQLFAGPNRNRMSQYSSLTHANPPPLSIPAPVLIKDLPVTPPPSGPTFASTSALLPPSHRTTFVPNNVLTVAQAPPSLPRKQSRKKLQRPQRPRSASSPPSTAMSRETAFSGETGESSTLVCHSTCAAGYTSSAYYPDEEEYERWKKGEGSSTGTRRFSKQPGGPRRTNTLPAPRAEHRYPHHPYGHRHSSSSQGTRSTSSNSRIRSRAGIWHSFSAALGLGRARSRACMWGAEDFHADVIEGQGRVGVNAALMRSGSEAASRMEVTVTTRTTVDVVDVRELVQDEEKMREEEEVRRRALRRTRSDLGGEQRPSSQTNHLASNGLSSSSPSTMRTSDHPQRTRAPQCFIVGEEEDQNRNQRRQEDEEGAEAPTPNLPTSHLLSTDAHMHDPSFAALHSHTDRYAHSKPDYIVEAETNININNATSNSSLAFTSYTIPTFTPPSLTPPRQNTSLSLPPSPERPVLPPLIIEPHAQTRTPHSLLHPKASLTST